MDDDQNEEPELTFDINHDQDESDESEMDDSPSPDPPADSLLARPPEAEVPADASFDNGFDVPGARHISRYLHLIQHLRQQEILYEAFLRVFGNCPCISSRS